MSNVNGVHALLALLVQQAQSAKQNGNIKIDVKQLEQLLQESRLLNERLLNIERLIVASRAHGVTQHGPQLSAVPKTEGNWPAAGLVRDTINQQERQQAFGSWRAEEMAELDKEPFSHRSTEVEQKREAPAVQQLLIQKYIPTDNDIAWAEISANYGAHRYNPDHPRGSGGGFETNLEGDDRSRLVVIAIGIALLLLTLFAALS